MSEIQDSIVGAINSLLNKNSSVALAIIYTIGHIIIAMVCIQVITGADFTMAATDAIAEPLINGVWFYVLHKTYNYLILKKSNQAIFVN